MVGRGAGKRGGEAKNAGKASAGEGVFFFFKTRLVIMLVVLDHFCNLLGVDPEREAVGKEDQF